MNEQSRPAAAIGPGSDAGQVPAGDAWVGSRIGGGADGEGGGDLLRGYVSALRNRRVLILGIMAAAVALALVLTMLSGRVYVARSTFEVQREALQVVNRDPSVETDPASNDELFMQTQFALLKSRSLAEGLVRRLRLDTRPGFIDDAVAVAAAPATGGVARGRADTRRFDAAVNKVMSQIAAAPLGTSSVIEVQAESDNPALSAALANGVVDEFIESSMQRRFAASNYARTFLARRLNEIKQRLEVSERQLVAYAEQQRILPASDARTGTAGASGGGQSLDSASLAALNEALGQARAARILAEANYRLAQRSGTVSAPAGGNPELAALRGQLAAAQADYEQKLATFKPTFPDMVQLAARIAQLRGDIRAYDTQSVAGAQGAYLLARDQEASLQREVDALKGSVLGLQNRSIQYTILQREVDTNRALYDALLQRYKEVGVSGGSGSNNVSIIDRARAPGGPARPILWLNLMLAFVAGLGLGVATALILEFLDDTFKQPDDVERKLHLPLLGLTPKLPDGEMPIAALSERQSTLSEAYQSVRTAIQLSSAGGVPHILCVTSAGVSEGKSTTSLALAKSFADQDRRVLLVDSDLRKPTIHRLVGLSNERGFSNVLSGDVPFQQAVQTVPGLGIDVLPCGPTPPNPALLLTTGLRRRFDELKAAYDIIIVDGPPVIGLADAPLLSDASDGTVMVVEANKQRRAAVRSALRRLSRSRTNLLGVVLTKFDPQKAGHGRSVDYMTYYYKYGSDRTD